MIAVALRSGMTWNEFKRQNNIYEGGELFRGAADAAEKVPAKKPRLLDRHKAELLGLLAEVEQIELRWHLALMVPRLRLTAPERQRAAAALQRYFEDRSAQQGPAASRGSRAIQNAC